MPDLEGRGVNHAARFSPVPVTGARGRRQSKGGERLREESDLLSENQALRERLSRLSEASIRITGTWTSILSCRASWTGRTP